MVAAAREDGRVESRYLKGMEFQFCKTKKRVLAMVGGDGRTAL